ncbi:hypothetical protein PHLCEN_2v9892 [Hermanssonia centrifuga]|uniref:Uncharacterized protein n=1 Tax=Hermanssonia centrifuga TaxID=98765 RepID=A0A2R6NQA9_9APHY|nr:hypothetical protein PHLCEN_2v9892 [Hermanssonia centrifuga]
MGLDWIGAILSTAGLGLLVCDLAESTTTPRGWATPFVPSLFGISIILIMSFVAWEMRREAKGQSVLLPMSMWTQPGTKMGPIILLVFFGWWGFNTLAYFVPLFYQEVLLLTPLQTAVRLVPMGVSLGTSVGLAVTSTIANSVSTRFNKEHPEYVGTSPEVLMAGFRAAGWTCCGTVSLSLLIAIVGIRGIGLAGQRRPIVEKMKDGQDIELAIRHNEVADAATTSSQNVDIAVASASVVTLTASYVDSANK